MSYRSYIRNQHSSKSEGLYIPTAKLEHFEMYLKAMQLIIEKNQSPKVSAISKILSISQPSVVFMLHKLDKFGLVNYKIGSKSIDMTLEGKKIATRMIRNTRLLEILMHNTLRIPIDDEIVCGIEHHMSQDFTDAICKLLGHPRVCPHGNNIPEGACCKK